MSKVMPDQQPEPIGFLLVPQFSMISLVSAVEPLRVANRLKQQDLYTRKIFSVDGKPVEASNGMVMMVDAAISEISQFPTVVVCASFEPERYEGRSLLSWLRRLARQGSELGALDTGTHVLARAGLLDGRTATLHWENQPGFAEEFPDINISNELFEIDGRRFTCSGGTAAIDLMLHRIAARHGQELAIAVSEQMLHQRIRSRGDHQRMELGIRLGIYHPKLILIVETMEQNLEEPLSLDELSKKAKISRRQLERLFRSNLNDTPTGFYLKLRLRQARLLLEQTGLSVLEVALACGFYSAPYFSRAYRKMFGRSPREDRRMLRRSPLGLGGE